MHSSIFLNSFWCCIKYKNDNTDLKYCALWVLVAWKVADSSCLGENEEKVQQAKRTILLLISLQNNGLKITTGKQRYQSYRKSGINSSLNGLDPLTFSDETEGRGIKEKNKKWKK